MILPEGQRPLGVGPREQHDMELPAGELHGRRPSRGRREALIRHANRRAFPSLGRGCSSCRPWRRARMRCGRAGAIALSKSQFKAANLVLSENAPAYVCHEQCLEARPHRRASSVSDELEQARVYLLQRGVQRERVGIEEVRVLLLEHLTQAASTPHLRCPPP